MSEQEPAPAAPRESSEATTVPAPDTLLQGSPDGVDTDTSQLRYDDLDGAHVMERRIKTGDNLGNLSFIELLIILTCYAFFFFKFIPHFRAHPNWDDALVLAAEAETILLLLIRRPAQSFSAAPTAWFLAMVTTVVPPLLLYPAPPSLEPAWIGAALLTAGLLARMVCTLFLGRSFGLVAANRGVKRSGPYRLVRHPIYASYLFVHAGILWFNPSLWNVAAYVACWSLMIPRILVEEEHLRQDPAYVEYAQAVRYRLIPGVF